MFSRPRLMSSPEAVIAAVADILGSSIVRELPAQAGFTMAVASWVESAQGRSVFVKAAPLDSAAGAGVRVGAELASVVGDLGPPLIGYSAVDGWAVAVYEVIDGHSLTEWDASSVRAMEKLSTTMRERLDPSPVSATELYADAFAPLLGTWSALASPDHPAAHTVAHVAGVPLPYGLDLTELAELENQWFDVLAPAATALQHGDLRRDNVVREPSGRLWLVDWTHLWLSPGWVDMVRVAPDIAARGHDPERFLRASAWNDAPPESVNVVLAGLAGRAWRDGHLPPFHGIPHLREMQREQGEMTMSWLASRLHD